MPIFQLTGLKTEVFMNYKLKHLGINCENPEQALKAANLLGTLFGWTVSENPNSVFADTTIECMKAPGSGKNGHIGIAVEDVAQAMEEMKERGIAFRAGTEKYNPDGSLRFIYLEEEVCGFALHLVQND